MGISNPDHGSARRRLTEYLDWLVGDPDLQALDSEGRAVLGYNSPFQSPIPSYLHPKYLDHVREWLMDVDECVRPFFYPRGPIIMVQLDNEPCMTFHDRMLESDYNPVNVGPGGYYQRWLQDKYGTIEALNTAYRSEWSSYDDVEPPRKVPTLKLDQLRQLTDWIEFRNGSWRHTLSCSGFSLAEWTAGVYSL